MADGFRSSSARTKKYPKTLSYSTFDPVGSIDSGLSSGTDNRDDDRSVPGDTTRERVSISWENIDVLVEVPGPSFLKRLCYGTEENENPTSKQILFQVSGKVEAGTFLAVLGASGAGKSTLMNVLAHRNIGQMEVRGSVEVNDRPIGSEITSMSAYIQQDDLFVGSLTVKEHLTFQAFLRMDKHVPNEQRIARVDEVILQLGLTKCADTYIGIPGRLRGISGGEKKRLSFASEVITDPPLLFADEPTSGLDSFMAESLIAALQQMTAQGRTVICTIHQPSSEVYAMFHSILLLAEGRTAYMGSTADAIQYFESLGYPCPLNFNPADYFVHTLAIRPGDEENCRKRVKDICDVYSAHNDARETEPKERERRDSFQDDVKTTPRSQYKVSWCQQFRSVFWRSWLTNNRDSVIFKIRFLQSIFLGFVVGVCFFQIPIDQDGIQNIYGVLFFFLTCSTFGNIAAVTFTFPEERNVFLREHHNGMYRTDVYFLSKTCAETPQFFLGPLFLLVIGYWMAGLRPDVLRFFYAYGILALVCMAAISYAYVVSTVSTTASVSTALTGPATLPLLLLGGYFIDKTTIPSWLSWLQYISWFTYGYEAMVVNQWDNYGNISCTYHGDLKNAPCLNNGTEVMEARGFNKDNVLLDIYCLLALIVGFRIIAYLFLLRTAYKKP